MLYFYLIIISNPNPPVDGSAPQRVCSVIHALARIDNHGTRPLPEEQRVPGYSGAQSCCHPPPNKSKPYYHTTYNEPPSKSVLNDIMLKYVEAMRQKNIPFYFLVGDLPTYKTITQIKAFSYLEHWVLLSLHRRACLSTASSNVSGPDQFWVFNCKLSHLPRFIISVGLQGLPHFRTHSQDIVCFVFLWEGKQIT